MNQKLAVIGVGNMAKAIIGGIINAKLSMSEICLYDQNPNQYGDLPSSELLRPCESILNAVKDADCVLISVKPQNYNEVLDELAKSQDFETKLYISIGAGITSQSVSERLNGACVIRVLPNVPILLGMGLSVICENAMASTERFEFVCSIFRSAGSILLIDESEMNRIIGVTSSSPAYVFQFISAMYQGALMQGLSTDGLLDAICDVVIGSAQTLKSSEDSPEAWIARVASKGGTTEKALEMLNQYRFNEAIAEAMKACTARADELGKTAK